MCGTLTILLREKKIKMEQRDKLLYEALETEIGGVQVYATALTCVINDDLKEEWEKYFEQTQRHVEVLQGVLEQLGLDPQLDTPGRMVVRNVGASLVTTMEMAKAGGDPAAAQIVAAECVVHAETKDHMNWELIGQLAKAGDEGAEVLKAAYDEVEDEEDEHLYHTMGWTRELWIESLGLPAVLPPPEEEKDVKTAIAAARAKSQRASML
jgi:rubrerythrin